MTDYQLTGSNDTHYTNPCEPSNLAESLDTGKKEGDDGSNGYKHSRAGSVGR